MNDAHLPLAFSVDKSTSLDTLEAVLAIARRGGVRLASLHLQAHDTADLVTMELVAGERDLLDLFDARLRNLIGVHGIETAGRARPLV